MKNAFRLGLLACLGAFLLTAAGPAASQPQQDAGLGGGLGERVPMNGKFIAGQQVVVAVSESGKTVYGYSDITCEWAKVTVENVETPIHPIVARGLAAFVSGTQAYAFGAQSGKWAVVELGAPGTPVVGYRVRVNVGSKIFLFSPKSEEWAVVDLSKD